MCSGGGVRLCSVCVCDAECVHRVCFAEEQETRVLVEKQETRVFVCVSHVPSVCIVSCMSCVGVCFIYIYICI